jgi:hypothetical protein
MTRIRAHRLLSIQASPLAYRSDRSSGWARHWHRHAAAALGGNRPPGKAIGVRHYRPVPAAPALVWRTPSLRKGRYRLVCWNSVGGGEMNGTFGATGRGQ